MSSRQILNHLRLLSILAHLWVSGCSESPFDPDSGGSGNVVVSLDVFADARVGSVVKLIAQVRQDDGKLAPAENVQWRVRQPALARMEGENSVRLLAEGTVTIEARVGGDVGITDILIKNAGPIRVAPDSTLIVVGSQRRVVARIWGGFGPYDYAWKAGELSWSTSDARVATINADGVITGVAPGRVTITASGRGTSGSGTFEVVPAVTFEQISVGSAHTCGVTVERRTLCWGTGQFSALGTQTAPYGCRQYGCYSTSAQAPLPVEGEIRLTQVTVSSLSEYYHSCGLDTAGAAFCWGSNADGQIGVKGLQYCSTGSISTYPCSKTPLAVPDAVPFTHIESGAAYTCGLTSSGGAYCWGSSYFGQSGVQRQAPVAAKIEGGPSLRMVSLGPQHACGLDEQGAAFCWGRNHGAQLGLGVADNASHPAMSQRAAGDLRFRQIEAGHGITCGITLSGETYCWGANQELLPTEQQCPLGAGSIACVSQPQRVAPGLELVMITLAERHACGLTAAGIAYCWGKNDQGQLGSGAVGGVVSNASPVEVAGGRRWKGISAGGSATCGITLSGVAFCWGSGLNRGIGEEITGVASAPFPVLGQTRAE